MRELTTAEKVDRLWDQYQIRNLMARYAYYGFEENGDGIMELFSKRDDAFVDCEGMGVFEGPAGLKEFFIDWHKKLNDEETDPRGIMALHALSTEMIEVASDGQTARGLWVSPGIEAKRREDGEMESYWIWGEYQNDFIRKTVSGNSGNSEYRISSSVTSITAGQTSQSRASPWAAVSVPQRRSRTANPVPLRKPSTHWIRATPISRDRRSPMIPLRI